MSCKIQTLFTEKQKANGEYFVEKKLYFPKSNRYAMCE